MSIIMQLTPTGAVLIKEILSKYCFNWNFFPETVNSKIFANISIREERLPL